MVIGDSNIVFDVGGGGTGGTTSSLAQDSILTSITGYKINIGTVNSPNFVEVRDYCPMYANCIFQSTDFKNSSNVQLSGIPYYSDDLWTTGVELPYYKTENQLKWVKRGTKPQFDLIAQLDSIAVDTTSTVNITRTDTKLTIGLLNFYPSNFKDRTIPTRLLVVLQGAGGSGGNGNWNVYGSGAGAGGFWAGIINLNYPVTINVAGPRSASSTSSPSDGKTGLTSYIIINDITCVTVNGGGAGKYDGKPEIGAGAGGSVVLSDSYEGTLFWTLKSFQGAMGGIGGNNGGNRPEFSVDATTKASDKHGVNRADFEEHFGGLRSLGGLGGGGGASAFADGGNGGNNQGGSGTKGSGGGGASISGIFGPNTQGGAGGGGVLYLYY